MKYLFPLAVLLLAVTFFVPQTGLADEHEGRVTSDPRVGTESEYKFEPIVPIPNVTTNPDITFEGYVNQLFRISISIGAILAVLMIIYGGFLYMTSEAMGGKKDGLSKIRDALMGLLLLLAVVIILRIINPCIIEINVFSRTASECSPAEPLPEQAEPENTSRYAESATDPDCFRPTAVCINPTDQTETAPTNNACTAPSLLRYKCSEETPTLLNDGSLIGPRNTLTCAGMEKICQNAAGGYTAEPASGQCPANTTPMGRCPAGSMAVPITALPRGYLQIGNVCVGDSGTFTCSAPLEPGCAGSNNSFSLSAGSCPAGSRPVVRCSSGCTAATGISFSRTSVGTATFFTETAANGNTVDASGTGIMPNPRGTGTMQIGLVGSITDCPVAIFKTCFNTVTRQWRPPDSQAGRSRCTPPTQLRDVCIRP